MHIVKTFEYQEDQDTGVLGWGLTNMPNIFNTGQGLLVAHDTLEHFPNTDES